MAIELVVSQARNGNPVLSVKGFNAGEVYAFACRVNTWLERYCSSSWKGYKSPARKDVIVDGMFYCPIPLTYNGATVSVFAIRALLEAMDKAKAEYEYIANHIGYVLPEAEEIDDLVSPFDGMDLDSLSVTQLKKLSKEHGVRFGSKFRKQEMIEALQDHLVIKR